MNPFSKTSIAVPRWRTSRLLLLLWSILLASYSWAPPTYSADQPVSAPQAANARTPQLFFPVVYHRHSVNNIGTWTSTLVIQNPSLSSSTSVQLSFYGSAGYVATPHPLPGPNNTNISNPFNLAPGATVTIIMDPSNDFISGLTYYNTQYAVVVSSELPVTGVNWVRVKGNGTESHGSYSGFPLTTATSVYLPTFSSGGTPFPSNLAIQNLSNTTLTGVDLTFYHQDGRQSGIDFTQISIPAYSAIYVDRSTFPFISGFNGSLVVTSPNGPVAVVDNKFGGTNGSTLFTYSGESILGKTQYVPFLSTQSGASATLTIQNTSNNQATGTITHSDNVGNTQFNLPPRGSQTITYNAFSHSAGFGATISADQPMVVVVNQQSPTGNGYAYEAFSRGETSYQLPLLAKSYQNTGSSATFRSLIQLFNPGPATTQVQLRYSNGTTGQQGTIQPGQSLTINIDNEGSLSNGSISAATVTSLQPIFAIASISGQGATGDLGAVYSGIKPPPPPAAIKKTASVPYLKAGQPLTYTLTFAAGASGGAAVMADFLPSQLISHTYTVGAGVVVTPTGNVDYQWQVAVPAAGGTIAVSGIVDPAIVEDLILLNTATITANNSSATSSVNVIVDVTPPDTSITNKPSDPSNATTPDFQFTPNDGTGSGLAGFDCQIDGSSWTSCPSFYTTDPLSAGQHTLSVRAKDQVGLVDPTPASYTWTIDMVPPTTPTLVAPLPSTTITNSQSITLTWAAVGDADLAGYRVDFNGTVVDVGAVTAYQVGPLANGNYTWTVAAIDAASNRSTFASTSAFTINATVPQVLALVPPPNSHTYTVTTPVSMTFSQSISASTVNTHTFAIHAMQSGQRLQAYSTDGATIIFTPQQPFKPGELVEVSAAKGLQTNSGIGLLPPQVWRFRAGVRGGSGQFTLGNAFGNNDAFEGTLGDVDGDGDLDFLVGHHRAGYGRRQSKLYLNDGDGTFDTTSYTVGLIKGSGSNRGIAFGDVDGDGDLDLAMGNSNGWGHIYLNDGVGNPFDTAITEFGAGNESTSDLAFGDVDGDGDLDLIQGCDTNGRLILYLNQGDGTFTYSHELSAVEGGSSILDLALGDIDLDGQLDLLVADTEGLALYLNDGKKPFDGTRYRLASGQYWDVAVGDLDRDGDLDMISTQETIKLYFNDGNGNPYDTTINTISISGGPSASISAIALGDVDGDSDLDIIMGNWSSQNLIYLNDGQGNFPSTSDLGTGDYYNIMMAIDTGDLDGDGDLDIASVKPDSGRQLIYLNNNEFVPVTPTATSTAVPPTVTPMTSATPTLTPTPTTTPSATPEVTLTPTAPTATPSTTPELTQTATPPVATPTPSTTAALTPTPPTATATSTTPTPTPTLPAADATIVAQPGQPASLTYSDPNGGGVAVQIPAGAIDQPTTFLYANQGTPSQPGAFQFAGRTFTLTAYRDNGPLDDFTFQQPVTLVLDYTDSDVAGIDENTLTLFFYDADNSVWSDQGIIVVARDPSNNRLTVQIPHLTEFAMGTAQRVYMPVIAK